MERPPIVAGVEMPVYVKESYVLTTVCNNHFGTFTIFYLAALMYAHGECAQFHMYSNCTWLNRFPKVQNTG